MVCNITLSTVEVPAKGQVLQVAGQHGLVHALVDVPARGQVLQATGKSYSVHVLIEIVT